MSIVYISTTIFMCPLLIQNEKRLQNVTKLWKVSLFSTLNLNPKPKGEYYSHASQYQLSPAPHMYTPTFFMTWKRQSLLLT